MINIFNWLRCDSPILTNRIKDKSSNSDCNCNILNQKTIKLAMKNAARLDNYMVMKMSTSFTIISKTKTS